MRPAAAVVSLLSVAVSVSPVSGTPMPEPAAAYFGSPKEGQVFVYRIGKDARRLLRIVRVTRDARGTRVDTEMQFQGLDQAPPPPETYYLDTRDDMVYVWSTSRPEEKMAILKGPVETGTRWEAGFRFGGTIEMKGACRVDRVAVRTVLGKRTSCAEVACDASTREEALTVTSRRAFCKGIGNVATDSTATLKGRPTQSLQERLLEIRW